MMSQYLFMITNIFRDFFIAFVFLEHIWCLLHWSFLPLSFRSDILRQSDRSSTILFWLAWGFARGCCGGTVAPNWDLKPSFLNLKFIFVRTSSKLMIMLIVNVFEACFLFFFFSFHDQQQISGPSHFESMVLSVQHFNYFPERRFFKRTISDNVYLINNPSFPYQDGFKFHCSCT